VKLDAAPLLRRSSEYDELEALKEVDVSSADNFYEATLPRTNKRISAAAEAKSMDARIDIDSKFYNLMNLGFERRLAAETAMAANHVSARDKRFAPLQRNANHPDNLEDSTPLFVPRHPV
jgi:hypothetical protein